MYIFSLIAGGCGATGVDEGNSRQKLLPLYSSQSSLTASSAFKIYGGSKKRDKDKSVKATTTNDNDGGKRRRLCILEFSDCMVRTPNYEIKARPQSLIGSPLHYTCPNWVRELELQELHGFKSTPSN